MRSPRFRAAMVAAMLNIAAPACVHAEDAYLSVRIVRPEHDATIYDNQGQLDIAVAVMPPLDIRGGDRLQLTVDSAIAANSSVGRFSLAGVARGPHTLQVEVRDRANKVLARSAPVVVHLKGD